MRTKVRVIKRFRDLSTKTEMYRDIGDVLNVTKERADELKKKKLVEDYIVDININ